jgi:cytochrome c peroxidase
MKYNKIPSAWLYMHLVFFLLGMSLSSCKDEPKVEPEPNNDVIFKVPSHFPLPHYNLENNAINNASFQLGKMLFYDPILSSDSSISCATCHAQVHGFADHSMRFSQGVNGLIGDRNSPALSNLAWYPSFMWDGGINHIEVMSFAPITNHVEMNEDMANVVKKLSAQTSYTNQFKDAFGSAVITDQKVLKALAQFMTMMVSSNSKYDQVITGKTTFTPSEENGYALFKTNCANCHKEPLLTDFSFRNNGLDSIFKDAGRMKITQKPEDNGKFKVPSLRNIVLTYPYMHDGRFNSLESVLNHYSQGIVKSSTLDPSLQQSATLTQTQQADIIQFLHTLTDNDYLANPLLQEIKK